MIEELKDFRIICLKCNSDKIVIDSKETVDYGGYTGVEAGCVVIKCKSCGNAYIIYT